MNIQSLTKEEDRLTEHIIRRLNPFFHIRREVWGKCLIDQSTVRIDLIIEPRGQTIEAGFPDSILGIEVKAPPPLKDTTCKKLFNAIRQASTYAHSVFYNRVPEFVMVYPGVKKMVNPSEMILFDDQGQRILMESVTGAIRRLMHKFCVGEVVENPNDSISFWLSGTSFYNTKEGRKKGSVQAPRRIGSKKLKHKEVNYKHVTNRKNPCNFAEGLQTGGDSGTIHT